MKAPRPAVVHIYPLSRLVHASPAAWERHLKEIEQGKRIAFNYYHPLREAVAVHCRSGGSRYSEALSVIDAKAPAVVAGPTADPLGDNRKAFESFIANFYPRIGSFKRILSHTEGRSCPFEGVRLVGSPHYIVTDLSGADRCVVLLASQWEEGETRAYLELLAVILREVYGAGPKSLWCMDLRRGKDFAWKSSPRVLSKCKHTAALYARLCKTLSGVM